MSRPRYRPGFASIVPTWLWVEAASCGLAPAKTVFPGWGRVSWGGPGGVIFDVLRLYGPMGRIFQVVVVV